MAKIITNNTESQLISGTYSVWKIALIGVASGLLYWLLTVLISAYIIHPIFCHSSSNALTCLSSTAISGNIATILVAVIGVIAMVRFYMAQPLIVAVTAAAALWGLSQWTIGLPVAEIIIFSLITYVLAYILFSWVTRYDRIWPVLVVILIIIMATRIVANL